MQPTEILIAAICGGLGGAIGGAIGGLFFRGQRQGPLFLGIAAAVIGMNALPPLLEPVVGPALREWTGGSDKVIDEIKAYNAQNPLEAELFSRHPDGEEAVFARLKKAYSKSGPSGLRKEAEVIGAEYSAFVLSNKTPVARSEDLIGFMEAQMRIADRLQVEDVATCYSWFFQHVPGVVFNGSDFAESVGPEGTSSLMQALIAIEKNASATPPVFDRAAAVARRDELAVQLTETLSPEDFSIVATERAAQTDTEMAAGCRGIRDYYRLILAEPNAGDILRVMLSG